MTTTTVNLSVNHHRAGKPVAIKGTVRVEIDEPGLAKLIAEKALRNHSGKSRRHKGLLRATVLAWEHNV